MIWYQKNRWTTAKKQSYNGIQYDSKFEAGYGIELEMRKKAGDIKDFIAHKSIPLIVNNCHIADYKIDFTIFHNDGTVEYLETKGRIMGDFPLRWKLFTALYGDDPNVTITLIKQGKQYKPRIRRVRTG